MLNKLIKDTYNPDIIQFVDAFIAAISNREKPISDIVGTMTSGVIKCSNVPTAPVKHL